MKIKTLLITIHLDENINKTDLQLRHFLVDTIESRHLGEVVEETSSQKVLELVIEVPFGEEINGELQGLLISLGFDNYNIQNISIDDT